MHGRHVAMLAARLSLPVQLRVLPPLQMPIGRAALEELRLKLMSKQAMVRKAVEQQQEEVLQVRVCRKEGKNEKACAAAYSCEHERTAGPAVVADELLLCLLAVLCACRS